MVLKANQHDHSGWLLRYVNANTSNNSPSAPSTSPTPTDVARHDRMVALVEAMLDLHRKLAAAVTGQEKTVLQRQIVATDRQIDRLVYELYGLTEEEIGIVEGLDHGARSRRSACGGSTKYRYGEV